MNLLRTFLFFGVLVFYNYSIAQTDQGYQQVKLRSAEAKFVKLNNIDDLSRNYKSTIYGQYYYLLAQFDAIPSIEVQSQMKESGIHVLGYVPAFTYHLAIPTNLGTKVLSGFGMRGLMAVPGESRLSPELLSLHTIPVHARSGNGLYYVTVSYPRFLSEDVVVGDLKKTGACIHDNSRENRRVDLQVSITQLEALRDKPYLLDVSPIAALPTTLDYRNTSEYGSRLIHKVKGIMGEGVTIGVGDNSKWDHVDGQNRVVNMNNSVNAHGNVVSGLIAGSGNIDENYLGHAPKSKILTRSQLNFVNYTSDFCNNYGMVLANHSYGVVSSSCTGFGNYNAQSSTVDQQLLDFPSLMHVFAAGNSGDDCPLGYNSILSGIQSSKNGLAVGNLYSSTYLDLSSSLGPTTDGRIKPEVCAKGINSYSTSVDNSYGTVGGTSSAAPAVVGVMALMVEQYRKQHAASPPGALMKAIACNTAFDIGNPGPDFKHGFGRIDAYRAMKSIEQDCHFAGTAANGSLTTHNLVVPPNTKQLKVLLYWNDRPGSTLNNDAKLVNDLDMYVTDANGTTYFPWVLDATAGNYDNDAVRGLDRTNNIEQVTIENPAAGNLTITVNGTIVPIGSQGYFISFDLISEDLEVLHPNDGTAVLPAKNTWISWGAHGNQETFSLHYSVNGGQSWNLIANNLAGNLRGLQWPVPNITSASTLVRVTQGDKEGISQNPFAIIGAPDIDLGIDCEDNIRVFWPPINGAVAYEVFRLGPLDTFMMSLGVTTDTFFVNPDPVADAAPWYSARAITISGEKGKRAKAKQVVPNPQIGEVNFSYGINYLDVDFINLEESYGAYLWDFGDGTNTNEANPSHSYLSGGAYNVCLTVYDNICSDSTICKELVIDLVSCRVQDSLQLVAILNNLSAYSTLHSLWDDRPLDDWVGIKLTDDGCYVESIDLPNGIIFASTFPALNLPELKILNLSGNLMSGEITGLDLPKIEELYLYDNHLSGVLPDFSNSPNLRILWLSNNHLTGNIPDFTSPVLRAIYLDRNEFSGRVPSFSNTILKSIWIQNNDLSGRLPDFSPLELVYLDINFNDFTFDGLEENLQFGVFKRDSQSLVPVFEENELMYVEVGGTVPYNEYSWYNENHQLVAFNIGNKFFSPASAGKYYCKVYNPLLEMQLLSRLYFYRQKNKLDIKIWLEGSMDYNSTPLKMNTELNRQRLLPGQRSASSPGAIPLTPAGQPYSSDFAVKWNYEGIEGTPFMEYSPAVVDWVLVSLYADLTPTRVYRSAALLYDDGHLEFFTLPARNLSSSYYILVEHRNHIAIMTPYKVPVINNEMVYNFQEANSYVPANGFGLGQKELVPGVWGMYAGDGAQMNPYSYDINGFDKIFWVHNNGSFTKYNNADFNMNGDVSGTDKSLMSNNNGIYSGIPRPID